MRRALEGLVAAEGGQGWVEFFPESDRFRIEHHGTRPLGHALELAARGQVVAPRLRELLGLLGPKDSQQPRQSFSSSS